MARRSQLYFPFAPKRYVAPESWGKTYSGNAVTVQTRSYNCAPGGDGAIRFFDPGGSFFNGVPQTSATAPVVTITTLQDLFPSVGVLSAVYFASVQPGHWEIATDVPGATLTVYNGGLNAVIHYTPTMAATIYIGARCVNAGGSSVAICRQHPGLRGLLKVGSGWAYATLTAAYAYLKALPNPGGYAIVVKDGTYTSSSFFTYYTSNGDGANQPNQPPAGDWTQTGTDANGDAIYSIQRHTCISAETPLGVILDGQNLQQNAVLLYGDTRREWDARYAGGAGGGARVENDFGDNWQVPGAARRGIIFQGFVAKNVRESGFHTQYVDHCQFRYCLTAEVSVGIVNANNSCVSFQNSLDCLGENLYGMGGARYKFTTYQSKRCVFRKTFSRFDYLDTLEPHAPICFYRGRDCYAASGLVFDSDNFDEFNVSSPISSEAGMCLIAATGVHDYPRTTKFKGILGFKTHCGIAYNDARYVSAVDSDFVWEDIGSWYHKPDNRSPNGGGFGIAQNGSSTLRNITSLYCDTTRSIYGINSYYYRQGQNGQPDSTAYSTLSNSIIYKYGHAWNGAGLGLSTFCAAGHSTNVTLENNYIFEASAATMYADVTGGSGITLNNINTTDDPATLGMRYPGRLEDGSVLKAANIGQDGFYYGNGVLGTYYGEAGYDTDSEELWLSRAILDLALPHFRDYRHTMTGNNNGLQTVSGDRGGAVTSKGLIDYIISKDGADVPFQHGVGYIWNSPGSIQVTRRMIASAYSGSITGAKIYVDGQHAETIGADDHGVTLTGLSPGRSFEIKIVLVDSGHGESGDSETIGAAA